MSGRRNQKRPIRGGVVERHQSLEDFKNLPEYLETWIRPNLLADINTAFEGAVLYWDKAGLEPGADGRGDFVLATALFAAFDHLGTFLAKTTPDMEWMTPTANIARLARCLPTTLDIYSIVAHAGRHALVHGAWPQTAIPMDGGAWAFGLSFNHDTNLTSHDTLHALPWKPKAPQVPGHRVVHAEKPRVLKLTLNIRVLRNELFEWVESGAFLKKASEDPKQFPRVQLAARHQGIPWEYKEYDAQIRPASGKSEQEQLESAMERQIEELKILAMKGPAWNDLQGKDRYPRQPKGHAQPS